MNSALKLIAISAILLACNLRAHSQKFVNETGNTILGLNAGFSATGLIYGLDRNTDTINYQADSRPAFQASVDYFTNKRFSVGFQASVQNFEVLIKHWEFENTNNQISTVTDGSAKMRRLYLGARLLLHHKNSEKLDVYSGLRIGAINWKRQINVKTANFEQEFINEFPQPNRFAIGILALGFRVKFNPQLAVNFDLNLGAPHVFSFGLNYALSQSKKN
jgi:hypothetical protein